MGLKERIKLIKEHFNLNTNQLSKIAKITRTAMANLENGTSSDCKTSVLRNIVTSLPINTTWLLTGKGSMLVSASNIDAKEQINRLQNELDFSRKEILAMRNINEFQKEKITRLENQLREKS